MTISNLRSRHQGVSVACDVEKGTWSVIEDWGQKAEVAVTSARVVFYERPADNHTFGVTVRGLQIRKDGTIGTKDRSNVSITAKKVPEEIRVAFIAEAQRVFDGEFEVYG